MNFKQKLSKLVREQKNESTYNMCDGPLTAQHHLSNTHQINELIESLLQR